MAEARREACVASLQGMRGDGLPNAQLAFRSNSRDVQAQEVQGGTWLRTLGDSFSDLQHVDLEEGPPGGTSGWVITATPKDRPG